MLTKDTAKDLWDSLKTKYQGTTRVQRAQRQALQKEYEMLSMHDGESVNEYFARILTVVNKLRVNKAKIEYPPVVEEQALKISFGEASGGRGHGRSGMRGRGRNEDYGSRSNYMENNEEMLLMACVKEEKSDSKADFWFLDSGCSNHGRKKVASTLLWKIELDYGIVGCLVGKQQRNPFPQESTWRASQVFELVHADICGPINPLSNSNKRYMITFIDDYSRKVWVYFLVTKSEAFVVFKQYKSRVEKESGVAIQGLRTDRGGEFTSLEFTTFCNDNGIHRKLTAPYTPQQNGIAERKNRTIMNMVKACYQIAKELSLMTRAKNVFFYVSKESKAYRLYDPVSNKIIVSRDVVFDEEASWDWEKSHKESVLMNLDWGESKTLSDATTLVGTSNGAGIDATTEHNEPGSTNVKEGEINTSSEDHSSSSSEEIPLVNDPQRQRQPPTWMQEYESGEAAQKNEKWRLAMDAEIEAIEKNDTWEMTNLPHGTKKAPRAWYSRIESYFTKEGFKRFPYEHTLFVKAGERDLGKVRYFLGIEVRQSEVGVFICLKRYAQGVLERFNMDKCNSVQNPIVLEAEFVAAASCACQAAWLR
nr:retrovirus-related Pol polyprotein from transposon TNT 1-94 [Tanacetum cinerariifolium]